MARAPDDLGEDYPHIHGPIRTFAVLTTGPYQAHLEEGLWLETRFDREWMDRILHPDFSEVGMSGRTSTRAETIDAPRRDLQVHLPYEGYRTDVIDEDVVLAHYISHDVLNGVDRHAHRLSVWVNTNEGWRLRFHQGTPLVSRISSRP